MTLEIRDPRLTSIVGTHVEFERIATGCLFTEGPLWHPTGEYLLWSDMPVDLLRRWSKADGVTTFRQPCNKSNGLTWDRQGRLVACEHASSQVTRTEPDGRITPIATHYDGKQLNSPNDIVCAQDGGIYFSDPPYGRAEFYGVKRAQELAFQGVYRVGADPRTPTLLVDDFDRPNGLCFSLDGRRLFVNDTARQHIRVFDVRSNGALAGGAVWAETKGEGKGAPDGMLTTIRENPERAEFIGVNVRRYELAAFTLAGLFAGLAGGLFGIFNRGVFPDFAYWTKSSEVLIMTLLGGMGTFVGPSVGALVLIWLNQQIVSYTEYWPLVLGTILVLLLFVFPGGLAGAAQSLVRAMQRKRGPARA